MQRMMTIENDSFTEMFTCPCTSCNCKDDEVMQHYYTKQQAHDSGWRFTNNEKYCEPGKLFVAVCPECWKSEVKDEVKP